METILKITAGCDCRCQMCIAAYATGVDAGQGRMTDDVFDYFLRYVRKFQATKVILSGGEPLSHPQLSHYVKQLRRRNIITVLNTSGSREAEFTTLVQTGDTRPDYVVFSLDSASQVTHDALRGHPGLYDSIWRQVLTARLHGVEPCVRFVVTRYSYQDLPRLIHLALAHRIAALKVTFVEGARSQQMHLRAEDMDGIMLSSCCS